MHIGNNLNCLYSFTYMHPYTYTLYTSLSYINRADNKIIISINIYLISDYIQSICNKIIAPVYIVYNYYIRNTYTLIN